MIGVQVCRLALQSGTALLAKEPFRTPRRVYCHERGFPVWPASTTGCWLSLGHRPLACDDVVIGLYASAKSSDAGPTTTAKVTSTTAASGATTTTSSAGVPPSTSVPVSTGETVHFSDASFTLPTGWVLNTPIQGSPQEGCLQAAEPSPDTTTWFGCAGVWVEPSTADPTQLSEPTGDPGQFWFMSTGVLPRPYPSSTPAMSCSRPGRLSSREIAPSVECPTDGTSGRTREFWTACPALRSHTPSMPRCGGSLRPVLPSPMSPGHPEVTGILGSVRVDLPATGSETTTTINPAITHPTSGVEFRSPTANIHCEINYGPPYPGNLAFCFQACRRNRRPYRMRGRTPLALVRRAWQTRGWVRSNCPTASR